jgi:hypothetical protein
MKWKLFENASTWEYSIHKEHLILHTGHEVYTYLAMVNQMEMKQFGTA